MARLFNILSLSVLALASSVPANALVSDVTRSSSAGSGKVGIAWDNGDSSYLQNFVTAETQFYYTWSPTEVSNSYGLEFVPMLWGTSQIAEFTSTVTEGYASPNEASQSNLTPQEAAALWQQYIEPLASEGYTLISPAPSSATSGFTWMSEFLTYCSGCTIDKIALHYYGTTATGMEEWITQFYDAFGKPIWVTEFANENLNGAQPSLAEDEQFMSNVTSWMQSTEWVEQYFAFGITPSAGTSGWELMDENGLPTALGSQYINS